MKENLKDIHTWIIIIIISITTNNDNNINLNWKLRIVGRRGGRKRKEKSTFSSFSRFKIIIIIISDKLLCTKGIFCATWWNVVLPRIQNPIYIIFIFCCCCYKRQIMVMMRWCLAKWIKVESMYHCVIVVVLLCSFVLFCLFIYFYYMFFSLSVPITQCYENWDKWDVGCCCWLSLLLLWWL